MTDSRYEAIIAQEGKLLYTAEDNALFPVVGQRDLVTVAAVSRPLAVGDIVLYRQNSDHCALRRIAGIRRGKYRIKSDSRTERAKTIDRRRIIGVVTSVTRGGRTFPAETVQEHEDRIAADLIHLVSCAVNDESPDKERVNQMDLQEVYRMAASLSLCAAAAFALERVIELPHAFDQAKKKAIRKQALFDIERTKILSAFTQAGIRYLPLKGILLKNDYPKTAMREMADNDILVDPSRMGDVKTIMESMGYTCDLFGDVIHDIYAKPPTLEFEMHRILFDDENTPLYHAYFADIDKKLIHNGCACKMTDEDCYLYTLCHMHKHYANKGTGLRSLLDLYVFLHAHPQLDTDYLREELAKLTLTEFEHDVRALSQKVFTGKALNRSEHDLLRRFITNGKYGTPENAMYNAVAAELSSDSKASKREYLKTRIFISGELLEKHYPFVAKHKILYPLLVVYRPIKGIIRRPKELRLEYQTLKNYQNTDREHETAEHPDQKNHPSTDRR